MSPSPKCSRLWEAEALEDGRLGDSDRASFGRHLPTCEECRAELRELSALRERVAALPNVAPTPFERHRVRGAILRVANERALAPRASVRPWVLVGVGALAIVAGLRLFPRRAPAVAPPTPAASVAPAGPAFHVDAEAGARWSTQRPGPSTVVALDEGEARFDVAHLMPNEHFVVALPDGEVEVRGTTFVVRVEGGLTRSVKVSTGRVALRLSGMSEILLLAGDGWTAGERRTDDADAGFATADPTPSVRVVESPVAATPPATRAGDAFDEAMGFFSAGQFAEADLQLAAFLRNYPNDARGEDAAFLRAVAHARLGDAAGAARLAAKYLRTWPRGFRRLEAQQLIDAAPQ